MRHRPVAEILEAKSAAGYVAKGYEWLAETASPFFKTIDFYNEAEKVGVSLKTVNAEKNFTFENILKNIDDLVNLKNVGSTATFKGIERPIKNVELHIGIPRGYNKGNLNEVMRIAQDKLGRNNVRIVELSD